MRKDKTLSSICHSLFLARLPALELIFSTSGEVFSGLSRNDFLLGRRVAPELGFSGTKSATGPNFLLEKTLTFGRKMRLCAKICRALRPRSNKIC